jgi:hypothetical protein
MGHLDAEIGHQPVSGIQDRAIDDLFAGETAGGNGHRLDRSNCRLANTIDCDQFDPIGAQHPA